MFFDSEQHKRDMHEHRKHQTLLRATLNRSGIIKIDDDHRDAVHDLVAHGMFELLPNGRARITRAGYSAVLELPVQAYQDRRRKYNAFMPDDVERAHDVALYQLNMPYNDAPQDDDAPPVPDAVQQIVELRQQLEQLTPDEVREQLDVILQSVQQIVPKKPKPKRPYQRRTETAKTDALQWAQPDYRKQPVYEHEFVCAVCGATRQIESFSATPPTICRPDENPDCERKHRAEYMRKYRADKRAER